MNGILRARSAGASLDDLLARGDLAARTGALRVGEHASMVGTHLHRRQRTLEPKPTSRRARLLGSWKNVRTSDDGGG